MKKKLFVFLLATFAVSVFAASDVLAQCAEGKQAVEISTPSGKVKTLCIPDAAVQGIENAAEHSGGTIVAGQCPSTCWSQDQIDVLNTPPFELKCKQSWDGYGDTGTSVTCAVHKSGVYSSTAFALYARDAEAGLHECKNYYFGSDNFDVNTSQSEACYALIQPFILNP
jgi:hypothetical protein